ncbi:MAG: Crp/Fnr family transcriptional regulator [Armatimonadetes bacterium]|nr:Crp/Fnr family transcriptional regulator [Armatimonadota bacterium]
MHSNSQKQERLKLWYLKRFNLFKSLPPEDIETLAKISYMINVKQREPIYFPGETANTIYTIKSGLVKISKLSPDGKEIILVILSQGEIFGEMTIMGEEFRDVEAKAMEDTLLCVSKKDDFLNILRKNPKFSFSITKLISFRLKQIEAKLENLLFKDVPTRLAETLIQLSQQYGIATARGAKFKARFTHQDLANLIGSTRETVSSFLAAWKKDGIIDMEGRKIVLLNLDKLHQLAKSLPKNIPT